jgi:AcrR family transcriptional regulator
MPRDLNAVKTEVAAEGPSRERARYHHGALREALIAAGEAILSERGVDGFSLREAARQAGVSPGAPAHHFGDARGLMTAIAARAFEGLEAVLREAHEAEPRGPSARIRAQGRAYVRFALAHPAQFDLMWRRPLLDMADPALVAAGQAAFGVLQAAVDGVAGDPCSPTGPGPTPAAIASWSMVHGYARLALDGAFDPETPGLLDGMLDRLDV